MSEIYFLFQLDMFEVTAPHDPLIFPSIRDWSITQVNSLGCLHMTSRDHSVVPGAMIVAQWIY